MIDKDLTEQLQQQVQQAIESKRPLKITEQTAVKNHWQWQQDFLWP